jgi:hypothetical protein
VVRIAFVSLGVEHEFAIAPAGTDHGPLLDELMRHVNLPMEAVRAYRGSVLLEQRPPLPPTRRSDRQLVPSSRVNWASSYVPTGLIARA